jgi:hypothetical protein
MRLARCAMAAGPSNGARQRLIERQYEQISA